MKPRWYKQAVIYCLDVETYMDGDGNGIGDFKGLMDKLEYISNLGANCIWLLPFYPSPNRDNGYDVKDYFGVDHRLGDPGDFVEFMNIAEELGLRVIVDLVINHTSIDHPWFKAAREDPDSKYRDYYVWSEDKPDDADEGMIFPGQQSTTWTYDRAVGAYYYHRFYKHQPELNIGNEQVREEMRRVMGYWLEMGVSGFRVDAAPFLIELKGIEEPDVESPYEYLSEFRDFLSWRRGDAILLAEANVAPEKAHEYFGRGTRMHMLFNFLVNQHLFLSLQQQRAAPLIEAMEEVPSIPEGGQWANFLRNHDELDLGRLSDEERQEVFEAFAPDEEMRLFGRGIRRRLPPMLEGDQDRIAMAYSMLFSLPGTPVIRYGEEIGMGEDLSLSGRTAVRTPMQWSAEENGGFSNAQEQDLIRPVIGEGPYGYEKINVISQRNDERSLLNRIGHMIRTRKNEPEFGSGECEAVDLENERVFAHRCSFQGGTVIAFHNLSDTEQDVDLSPTGYQSNRLVELVSDKRGSQQVEDGRLTLDRFGYRWFRVLDAQEG